MSIYLYNLAFSLNSSDTPAGRFQQYNPTLPSPTIANQSCAWFTCIVNTPPAGYGDWFQQVFTALNPSQWNNPQPDSAGLDLDPGDYLALRIFCSDANVSNYRARVTGVFGQGTSTPPSVTPEILQSPLVMSTSVIPSTYPRAVIDVDGSSSANWPSPIAADGSWLNWLGGVHTPPDLGANDYTLNVGICVANGSALYTFGTDPHMHVGGSMKRHKDHLDAA